MENDDLHRLSIRAADWARDYRNGLRDRPVRAQVRPGDIAAQLPKSPPETPESADAIFDDFEAIVPDGMTH